MRHEKSVKMYNLLFPIWLLLIFPISWLIVLPVNFFIDLGVLFLSLIYLKIDNKKELIRKSVLRIWILGFIADFIGVAMMFVLMQPYNDWWNHHISYPLNFNPFESVYALFFTTCCVIVSAYFIYCFNYKICLQKTSLNRKQKKIIALFLAVFTAPYFFFLPSEIFYWDRKE